MNTFGSNSIDNIPFDQYQRYKTVSLVIEKYRKVKKSFTVLEIGANEHKNLEKFLPNDIVKYLDIKLPEHLQKDESYITADATNMHQVKNDSYDIVIALDVFEHIPQNLRNNFLSELNRVSIKVVILAGPFDENGVSKTEKKVNQYYKTKYGIDYIWLKEHIENKLPDLNKTINYIKNDLECSVNEFSHGSLEIWEKLMQLHFEVADSIELQNYRMNIDNFYNRYLYKFDISRNNYRNFLIFNKKEKNDLQIFTKNILDIDTNDMEYFNSFINSIYKLSQDKRINQKYTNKFIQIFIEDDKGISEENSICLRLEENSSTQKFEFDLSNRKNIKLLRIDILNDYCIVKLNKILVNDIELNSTSSNACHVIYDIYYFNTIDPQIYFDTTHLEKVEKLTVDLQYLHVSEDALNHIVNDLLKIFVIQEEESKNLKAQLESKEEEIQEKNLYIAIIKQRLKTYYPGICNQILGGL